MRGFPDVETRDTNIVFATDRDLNRRENFIRVVDDGINGPKVTTYWYQMQWISVLNRVGDCRDEVVPPSKVITWNGTTKSPRRLSTDGLGQPTNRKLLFDTNPNQVF